MENNLLFYDHDAAKKLLNSIKKLPPSKGRVNLMEVCGTHTMEIGRLGLRKLLPENIHLISGPGCPVCVTPGSYIDVLISLVSENKDDFIIATFGDMMHVPGSNASFSYLKSQGAAIEVVASPITAIDIAIKNRNKQVIFAAVGFETTVPAVARTIQETRKMNITNLTFFSAHRLVPPILKALIKDPGIKIDSFILPGHVSTIIGEEAYSFLNKEQVVGVITGFEALDIISSIYLIINMIDNNPEDYVKNNYPRLVKREGNLEAKRIINTVFEPCDAALRGIGMIPGCGLKIREEYSDYDASKRFPLTLKDFHMPPGCSCGEVLKGLIKPTECPLFGNSCTPQKPVGPCMVSSEGSCSAYYKYGY
jgi:hydrogenase expression/formation protein HypD